MVFKIRGTSFSIAVDDVLNATRDIPPMPTDGRNKYFVTLHDRQYPIKQVVRLVTRLPPVGFTAQDAHRILSRLGFDISEQRVDRMQLADTAAPVNSAGGAATLAESEVTGREDEMLRLLIVFEADEDGWVMASCPTLRGCHSQGRTKSEALDNIREAVRGYLASMREHGAARPASSEFQVIEVRA